jgi:hypothetical protein
MVQSLQTTRSATTHRSFSLKTLASCFNRDSATGIDSRAWAWNGTDRTELRVAERGLLYPQRTLLRSQRGTA